MNNGIEAGVGYQESSGEQPREVIVAMAVGNVVTVGDKLVAAAESVA